MFNLGQLQAERARKAVLIQEIVDRCEKAEGGGRPMSAEETSLFDKLHAEIETHDKDIAAVIAHMDRREKSAKLLKDLEAPSGRKTQPDQPGAGNAMDSVRVPANPRRNGALKAFKARPGETARDAEVRAYRAGQWARAMFYRDERAQHWCQTNGMSLDVRGAMGTNSNPDGGFLVADEMSQAIIDLREEYGVARKECRVWPMGSDTMMIPRRSGGITIGPVGENPSSAISQSNPAFNQVTLVAKKIGGLCLLSSEIAEDAVLDLAEWVAQEFAYAFAKWEDDAFFTGDGTSTWHGIRGLGNLFTTTGGAGGAQLVGAVDAGSNHDTFAEIDASDLTTLMGKLPAYALPGAKWYCSSVCANVVFGRLAAAAGGNTTQTLREGLGLNYLGYPIVISQSCPTSTGDLSDLPMLYFGNLRMSSNMGDRRMVKVFPSEHRYMDTDQIGIRGLERIDIVHSDVGDTTTGNAGPVVALVGE